MSLIKHLRKEPGDKPCLENQSYLAMLEASESKERKSTLVTANESMKRGEISLIVMLQITSLVSLMMNGSKWEPKEDDPESDPMMPKGKKLLELKPNSTKANL